MLRVLFANDPCCFCDQALVPGSGIQLLWLGQYRNITFFDVVAFGDGFDAGFCLLGVFVDYLVVWYWNRLVFVCWLLLYRLIGCVCVYFV